jgi:hypothetical protein
MTTLDLLTQVASLATLVSLLVANFQPFLVALVTRDITSSPVKGVLLALISAANGFITAWYNSADLHQAYNWRAGALQSLGAFVIAVGAYFGIWRKTVTIARLQAFPARPVGNAKHGERVSG